MARTFRTRLSWKRTDTGAWSSVPPVEVRWIVTVIVADPFEELSELPPEPLEELDAVLVATVPTEVMRPCAKSPEGSCTVTRSPT